MTFLKTFELEKIKKNILDLFVKNDVKTITSFPYNWSEEYFPPLSIEERHYMQNEIIRWFETYISTNQNKINHATAHFLINRNDDNEEMVIFKKQYPDEFILMIDNHVFCNINPILNNLFNSFSDSKIISWKPISIKQENRPPNDQLNYFMNNLVDLINEDIKDSINESFISLQSLTSSNVEENQEENTLDVLVEDFISYLDKNKSFIIKTCFKKILLEYDGFSYDLGSKQLNNPIFNEYKDHFGFRTYKDCFGQSFIHIKKFLDHNDKTMLNRWLKTKWPEYLDFMKNYFVENYNNDTLNNINFNKYFLAVDFFVIIMFSMNMDGIKKEEIK